jgi:ribonuclease HI
LWGWVHTTPFKTHSFHTKLGLGQGTNNYAELLTLKLLLTFAKEKDLRHIQIFGDSMIVVNWARKLQKCHNIFLLPILEDTFRLLENFDTVTISHVYRNRNMVADALSKAGLHLALGHWDITEHKNGNSQNFYHRPFIDTTTQQQIHNMNNKNNNNIKNPH